MLDHQTYIWGSGCYVQRKFFMRKISLVESDSLLSLGLVIVVNLNLIKIIVFIINNIIMIRVLKS